MFGIYLKPWCCSQFSGVNYQKGQGFLSLPEDSPKSKGKVKQVAVGTRQPTAQSRGIKHDAVTQAGAVEVPLPPVPSAPFYSEIIPGEALNIPCNTFAFSSLMSLLARCLIAFLDCSSYKCTPLRRQKVKIVPKILHFRGM